MSDFAKAIGASFNRAIEFDNQIASGKQKYSNWILGLATAGFTVALTQTDKILAHTWASPVVGNIALKSAAAIFILFALVGAVVVRCVDRQVDFNRQSMTLILRQELLLVFSSPPWSHGEEPPEKIVRKLTSGQYLDAENRKTYEEARLKSKVAGTWAERLLVFQQVLVGIGYATIFDVAVG
jgi:hypothetical protein